MPVLHLDYQREFRPFPLAGVLLLVAAVAALGAIGNTYREQSGKLATWESQAERMERLARRHGISKQADGKGGDRLAQEVAQANEILRRLDLPWASLFQAVESSSLKDAALLAMDPDADKHLVRISGEAKNLPAVLDYMRVLEKQQVFRSVLLQSHQLQVQDPERPVRFVLAASWKDSP